MKQFLEYIPLLLFFSVWAMDERVISILGVSLAVGGIFNAATFLLVASICVYGGLFLFAGKLDKFQWITFVGVIFACTLTIVFRALLSLNGKLLSSTGYLRLCFLHPDHSAINQRLNI